MFGFGYLLVPLYDIFCEITGLNGKTGRVEPTEIASNYQPDLTRTITVQFIANHDAAIANSSDPLSLRVKLWTAATYGM